MFDAKGNPINLDNAFTTDDAGRLQKAYLAVYGKLDKRQTFRIDQMCEMFTAARLAYVALSENVHRTVDEAVWMSKAGMFAEQFDIHRQNLREEYGGCGEDELCRRIDATSKWLLERGWIGLPELEDANGARRRKTAAEMCIDMKRCMESYHEMTAAMQRLERRKQLASARKEAV